MHRGAECLTKALQLQHTRCEVYQLWDAKFHRALSGALGVAEFDATLSDTIVAAFQQVSSSLRQLQDDSREEAEGGSGLHRFLYAWIDQVQQLEQEHYRISVLLLQQLAEHCTALPLTDGATRPVDASVAEAAATTTTTTGVRDHENGDAQDAPKPGDATEGGKPAPAVGCGAYASLHDAEHCVVRHLIPVSSQTALTYVSCRDATSLCSAEEEEEDAEEGRRLHGHNDDDDDGEEELVPFVLPTGVKAAYDPRAVQRRCQAFRVAALPLWQARRAARQRLQDCTDELREELASAAAAE